MKIRHSLRFAYILAFAIITSFASCKKDSTEPATPVVTAPTPVITPVGQPIGNPTSATIGATGGTITSADGHLTLNIPAGALSSNVTISITPISNEAPLAFGDGYRLEPQGTTFAVPITYTFSYTDDMLTGTDEHFLWIVTQASDGHWNALQHSELDAAANTITVHASHFSDWSLGKFVDLSLTPQYYNLPLGQSLALSITGFDKPEDLAAADELVPLTPISSTADQELTPLTPIPALEDQLQLFQAAAWTLNGIQAPTSGPNGSLTGGIRNATFTAPNTIPSVNPVAVTVELFVKNVGNQSSSFYITSNITIVYTNLYATVTVDGNSYTYYQYGTNGALPQDPNHYFVVNASVDGTGTFGMITSEILNGTSNGHEFGINHEGFHQGTNVLHGTNFLNYTDDVTWLPNYSTDQSSLNYETRVYDAVNSICNTEYESGMVVLKVTKYSALTHIAEATFQGSVFEDSQAAQNNCLTPIEHKISGSFRLYIY